MFETEVSHFKSRLIPLMRIISFLLFKLFIHISLSINADYFSKISPNDLPGLEMCHFVQVVATSGPVFVP